MEINNFIKALKGEVSLLLILPNEVSSELHIANQDWLKFEIKNSQLVIKKLEVGNN
jgi:antitoxin component of MazEF toxin-antitoxin module